MQTVYGDVYFLINFSMDFLCLYLTARLLSVRLGPLRGILASAVGGIYAVAALLVSLPSPVSLAADILLCICICALAFGCRQRVRRTLAEALVYAAVSVALGGGMTALFYLLNRTGLPRILGSLQSDGLSVWLFALLAAISAALTLVGGRGAIRRMSAREVELEMTLFGRTVRLSGIVDSGNLLRDPISGRPCVVVDRGELGGLLPQGLEGVGEGLSRLSEDVRRRIVLIPARTASGECMLVGLRAERIVITCRGEEKETDALVALSELEVGALVPSCLLT